LCARYSTYCFAAGAVVGAGTAGADAGGAVSKLTVGAAWAEAAAWNSWAGFWPL
jgi:hypothetical protein